MQSRQCVQLPRRQHGGPRRQGDAGRGHIIVDVKGFKLGIIGLTYRDTPKVTLATNIGGSSSRLCRERLG